MYQDLWLCKQVSPPRRWKNIFYLKTSQSLSRSEDTFTSSEHLQASKDTEDEGKHQRGNGRKPQAHADPHKPMCSSDSTAWTLEVQFCVYFSIDITVQ